MQVLTNKGGNYKCNAAILTSSEVEGLVKPHNKLIIRNPLVTIENVFPIVGEMSYSQMFSLQLVA